MTDLTRADIERVIQSYQEPYYEQDLISAKAVTDIQVQDTQVKLSIELGFPAKGYAAQLSKLLQQKLEQELVGCQASVTVSSNVTTHEVQQGLKPLPGIKNIIAVASGKGGVGKSTTTVNLALALSADGASVGILDADIYGPSQPRMLGVNRRPESKDGKRLEPIVNHGVQAMSIGFLIEEDSPMIWRGPMVTGALEQLLRDTHWRELDYLIIDLPPGTGDIQLTLAQKIPVSGAIIVTTPQDIALLDARKGLKMFEKVEVSVLGVVENMSTHICSQCGHEEHIFGEGGGSRMAEQYGVRFLGSLPLDIRIRQEADDGHPTVAADPDGAIAQAYHDIARRATAKLALQARSYSQMFPNIVIQNS
jgi:ATP-binding protein involved in chromosome partitioning